MTITPYQHLLLLAAASVDAVPQYSVIPFGVYHSLVLRGLLAPHRHGFEITPEGRGVLARGQVVRVAA